MYSSLQKENPIQMHYFPKEGRFDKMYFPYYGKKAHVSVLSSKVHVNVSKNMSYMR